MELGQGGLLPNGLVERLKRQKYQLVGRHSAVKKCRWLHQSLTDERSCYKHRFFGIKSWQCIQMTPWLGCDCACLFCWRVQPRHDLGIEWDETKIDGWDEPEIIALGAIEAQRKLLTGYRAHPRLKRDRYREALNPRHAAISLAGEPTLYPALDGLLHQFHKRGFTTFVVTNGTHPDRLEALDEEPTQLYVTVAAPDRRKYTETCRPSSSTAWSWLMETLNLLPSLTCPTVMRLTLADGLNLENAEGYAKLISRADPTYVECKGAVWVGYARRRLGFKSMPTHQRVKAFAERIASISGYKILDESVDSRVILLSDKLERPTRLA